MDNISYPRALNRPTYLIWRFTHQDVALIFAIFIAVLIPSGIFPGYPTVPSMGVVVLYIIYRGTVVTIKPRGWERHVVGSWLQPKQLNPGHCFHQCFIREEIPKKG